LSITPSGYQGWLVVCKMPQLIVAAADEPNKATANTGIASTRF
jgi:hypothetical protein